MEEEFNVKTLREGNVKTNQDIESILNVMACEGFNNRYLGVVAAVVEKTDGRITKQKLNWGEANDPNFNKAQQKNADALLAATVKAVEGGGDPSEMKVKFVVKL